MRKKKGQRNDAQMELFVWDDANNDPESPDKDQCDQVAVSESFDRIIAEVEPTATMARHLKTTTLSDKTTNSSTA